MARARCADAAYGETARWLRETYAPRASDTLGIGAERFGIQAGIWFALQDPDLDESYDWAAEEYRTLVSEQRAEAAKIDSTASVAEMRAMRDADPAHVIEGPAAFRDWAQDLVARAVAALARDAFDIPAPLRRCDVRMVEDGAGAGFDRRRWHSEALALGPLGLDRLTRELETL